VVLAAGVVPSSMEGATRDFLIVVCLAKTAVATNIASNVVQLHVHSLLQGPTQVLLYAPTGTQPPPMTKADIDCRSGQAEHLSAKRNEQFPPPPRPRTMRRRLCQPMSGPRQSRSRTPLLRLV
jgi:hypothetical protein